MKRTSLPLIVAGTAASLLLATPAVAGPDPQWFASELEAVVGATRQYNPRSIREDREFMGAILRHDDCFTFTVGAGEPGRDRVSVRIVIPTGAEVVAFWHTHGARHPTRRYFSDVDTALVESWPKRFYLADHTGTLKVIAPGMKTLSRYRARQLGLPPRAGYARGDVITDASGAPIPIATSDPATRDRTTGHRAK